MADDWDIGEKSKEMTEELQRFLRRGKALKEAVEGLCEEAERFVAKWHPHLSNEEAAQVATGFVAGAMMDLIKGRNKDTKDVEG